MEHNSPPDWPDEGLAQGPAAPQSRIPGQQESFAPSDPALDKVSDDLLRRVPPQNLEAEQAVLGGVFIDNTTLHSLVDLVNEDDFYYPANRMIYAAFLDLYRTSVPVDLITVAELLKNNGMLEQIGGPAYLADLTQSVISASNAYYHAKIVRDKAVQRQLISASTEIIASCFDSSKEVDAILDESESSIFAISERTLGSTTKTSKELVKSVFEALEKRVERKELVTGVNTGYEKLNEITAGFQPSDLIIMAGRPSMGKTAFALNTAMRSAVMFDVPVAIFSLEMSMESLMMRMLCAWGKVDLGRLRRGFLDDSDWMQLYEAANNLGKAPIFIDDTPAITTLELRARCRRLKAEKNLGMIVVDYLQLMRPGRKVDSREQEISEISRTLKALAKELNVPVIALSQLNRKVEERADKRPMLSDLRESGAIEQDADLIIFLYRDFVYNKNEDNPKKNIAEIILGKQRNGPTGTVELVFMGQCTAFEELEHSYPSEQTEAPA